MPSLDLSEEVLVDWASEGTSVSLSDEREYVLSSTKNKNKKNGCLYIESSHNSSTVTTQRSINRPSWGILPAPSMQQVT